MAGAIIRDTLCTVAKVSSPKKTLSDAALAPVADAIGAVLDKYGVNLGAMAGDWIIEIRAAFVTVPLIIAARAALMSEIAAMKAEAQVPVPETEPVVDGAADGADA